MSATLESEKYARYFAMRLPWQPHPVPACVLSVDGRMWPVMDFYLDNLLEFGSVRAEGEEGGGREERGRRG